MKDVKSWSVTTEPPIPKSEKCAEQCANSRQDRVCTSLKNLGQTVTAARPAKLLRVSPALHNFHSLSANCWVVLPFVSEIDPPTRTQVALRAFERLWILFGQTTSQGGGMYIFSSKSFHVVKLSHFCLMPGSYIHLWWPCLSWRLPSPIIFEKEAKSFWGPVFSIREKVTTARDTNFYDSSGITSRTVANKSNGEMGH